MINGFLIRKFSALILSAVLTTVCFFVGFMTMGMMWAFVFMFGGLVFGVVLGSLLLNNPFQTMLEGKGILTIPMDSTGMIQPFIVSLQNPYVKGRLGNQEVTDVFNRDAVFMMDVPKKAEKPAEIDDDGSITIKLSSKEVNSSRFGLWQYPVFFYNKQNQTMLTKDFLATHESDMMARHNIIFLNRKVEELSTDVKNFARHVVELHRKLPFQITGGTWVIIIVVIVLGILAIFFAPGIIESLQGTYGTVNDVVN